MKRLEESLTQYAAYHRDRRNIATHFVGIPLIVFAVVLALALAAFPVAGMAITLAAAASIAACAYYFRLDPAFGSVMAAALFVMCAAASEITARLGPGGVLALAALLFTLGWALQFWGHRFEGMQPAFYDDAKQLLIGPLFVCAEVFFLFGAKPALRRYIEERVGPTVARRAHPAATGPR
ncbi:MAG: DUF962 domain-containing protein [Betaproteobacteria bacterium]|nr:DUF962 domain-containing protein [Betaproteobacteria bacterium]